MACHRAPLVLLGLLVLSLLPGIPSPLAAAPLTYDFSGTITLKYGYDPQQYFQGIVIGMPFSGTLIVDLTLYQKVFSGSSACENFGPTPPGDSITVTMGDYIVAGYIFFLHIGNDLLGDEIQGDYLLFHSLSARLISPVLNVPYAIDDLVVILRDVSGTALANSECPSEFDPGKFPDGRAFSFYAQFRYAGDSSIGGHIEQFYRVIPVALDIKPGDPKNVINLKSQGKIPMAILSTDAFAAPAEVDPSSLRFGRTGDEASLSHCDTEDVNADGLPDLMCHFFTQAAAFQPTDTQGFLKGMTLTGVAIRGSDAIQVK